MKLKILILPTFIILELILAIGYIKPNIDEITTKQTEIAVQKDGLSRVDSVQSNIGAISDVLERRRETVGFVERYYPKMLDEERVVDMFNYLAQQSGDSVVEVSVKQNEKVATVVEGALPVDGSVDPSAPVEAPAESPDSYEVEISVLGEYTNIKEFFNRVHHADRLHRTKEFSITYRKDDELVRAADGTTTTEVLPKKFLLGTIIADFPYIKEKHVANALNIPMFQSSEFNFTEADKLVEFVTNPLPPLEADSTGKTNPFE